MTSHMERTELDAVEQLDAVSRASDIEEDR